MRSQARPVKHKIFKIEITLELEINQTWYMADSFDMLNCVAIDSYIFMRQGLTLLKMESEFIVDRPAIQNSQ